MIALDTNAIVRVLIEDDVTQAKKVQSIVKKAEEAGDRLLILSEVVIETVWVLESVYECNRTEIVDFIENVLAAPTFHLPDSTVIRKAIRQYREKGDFADLLIVGQAKKYQAKNLFTFDRKLQQLFPDFATESASATD